MGEGFILSMSGESWGPVAEDEQGCNEDHVPSSQQKRVPRIEHVPGGARGPSSIPAAPSQANLAGGSVAALRRGDLMLILAGSAPGRLLACLLLPGLSQLEET